MVVTRHGQHTAPFGGAGHVGMFENVGAAVHARALAVPNAKNAVELVGARWRKSQLLRAPQGSGGQFLVHARLENNVLCFEVFFGLPKRLVVPAQWRTAVTADKTCRVFASQLIPQALQHGQLDQRLHATHEGAAVVQTVFVVQRDSFQSFANMFGQGRIHGLFVSGEGCSDAECRLRCPSCLYLMRHNIFLQISQNPIKPICSYNTCIIRYEYHSKNVLFLL